MGERGGHWQSVLGQQGGGAGAGRQIPGRAVQPERRGETALPDGPAIKGRNTPARLPPRFPAPGKCTSHLGFGLGAFRPDRPRGQGHQRRRHRMSGRFPVPWRAVATPSMNVFNAHCLKSNITELRSHKVSWQIQPRHSRYLGHRRRKDSPQRIGGVDSHVRRAGVRPL